MAVVVTVSASPAPIANAKPEAKPGLFAAAAAAAPLLSAAYSPYSAQFAHPVAYTAGYAAAPYYAGGYSPYAAYSAYPAYPSVRYTAAGPLIF